MIVVATQEEKKIAEAEFPNDFIVVTGVGGLNVVRKLQFYPRDIEIINLGYVGSNTLRIGSRVNIGKSRLYHPNVEYHEPEYTLDGDVPCYTSNDFVLQTDITEPVVFDMELAYILALGFKNVKSIKIVSDNLNMEQYEETIK